MNATNLENCKAESEGAHLFQLMKIIDRRLVDALLKSVFVLI